MDNPFQWQADQFSGRLTKTPWLRAWLRHFKLFIYFDGRLAKLFLQFLQAVSSVVLYQVDSMSQMKEKWKNSSGLMLCKMVNLRNYNWVIIGGPLPAHIYLH